MKNKKRTFGFADTLPKGGRARDTSRNKKEPASLFSGAGFPLRHRRASMQKNTPL